MQSLKIIVLRGGKSPEREVSLVSGKEISQQLTLNGHHITELDPVDYDYGHDLIAAIHRALPDLVFIGLHGGDGENGVLQAMLTGSGIRFTGSGYKASAVAMDKLLSKIIASQAEVPVPDYVIMEPDSLKATDHNGFSHYLKLLSHNRPTACMVIKPVDAGSSVGVHIVSSGTEWDSALRDAFQYSDRIMVEEYIEGREFTVTILGKRVLPVVEIKPRKGFYDYANKYSKGNTEYQAPAELTPAETARVQHYAQLVWHAMECCGYGRIDFRYDGREFYFLEVNTLPGMTPLSLTPMAAKAVGINFSELLDTIILAARPDLGQDHLGNLT